MNLVIYGLGGMAREVMTYAIESNLWDKYCFTVDREYMPREKNVDGIPVYPYQDLHKYCTPEDSELLICVGEPKSRKKMYDAVKASGYKFGKFVDPSVVVHQNTTIEEGTIILRGCILASDVIIHKNVALSFGVIVGHDSEIGEHAYIAPGVLMGGFSKWGECSFGGMGSVVRDHAKIGNFAIVGQGAVVVKDVDDGLTVVGNPAKELKNRDRNQVF